MRISDWSSDVCSSDLFGELEACVFAIPSRRSPALVTQLIFKNAPDGIARQFVAKLDITRHRKIGDPVRAPRAHLRLGHLAFAIKNDRGFHIVLGAFGQDRKSTRLNSSH